MRWGHCMNAVRAKHIAPKTYHLRVAHVLVQQHTLDQLRVLQPSPNLPVHLNQLKVHVLLLHVCDLQHCVDGDLRKLPMASVHTATRQDRAWGGGHDKQVKTTVSTVRRGQ